MMCPHVFEPVDASHLASCPACRLAGQSLEPAPPIDGWRLSALKGPALAELRKTGKAKRWWVDSLRLLWGVTAVGLLAAFIFAPAGTPESIEVKRVFVMLWSLWGGAGIWAVLAPGMRVGRWVLLAGAMVLSVLMALLAPSDIPGASTAACGVFELLIGIVPGMLALRALTKCTPSTSRMLLAGVVAIVPGVIAIELHCRDNRLLHQLLFHAAPIVLAAVTTLIIRRMLVTRAHAP